MLSGIYRFPPMESVIYGRPFAEVVKEQVEQSGATAVFLLASLLRGTAAEVPPDKILLKDYKPRSIFKIPETRVEKARYPVIDVHSHASTGLAGEPQRLATTRIVLEGTGPDGRPVLAPASGTLRAERLA